MRLKAFRLRKNAKLPQRAHDTDAGMDLFFCAKNNAKKTLTLYPRQSIIIPTGIKVEVPTGYMLEIKNKSSIASKRQLVVGACVVDAGYNGEVFVNLHNVGLQTQFFDEGDKIAQGVLIAVEYCTVEEVFDATVLNIDSSRGIGALGSTGTR